MRVCLQRHLLQVIKVDDVHPVIDLQLDGVAAQRDDLVINYYFPVEIEVIGTLTDEQIRRVSTYVFDELTRELASRM